MRRWIPVFVSVLGFGAGALPFLRWIPDDAWISLRYSRQFAQHQELVFNPGERVEGFSNLLWTVIAAAAAHVGIEPVTMAFTMSLVATLVLVLLALGQLRRAAGVGPGARTRWWSGAVLIAGAFPLWFWASSAMETTAVAAMLLGAAILNARAHEETRPGLDSIAIILLTIVTLTRPEGFLFLIAFLVHLTWRSRGRPLRPVAITGAVSVLVCAVVLLWRWSYYGEWLPNTAIAKPPAAIGYLEPLFRGARYIVRFTVISGLAGAFLLALRATWHERASARTRALATIVIVQTAFIVIAGGDILRFDRFTVALHVPLVLLAVRGAALQRFRPATALLLATAFLAAGLNVARAHRALTKYCEHDWMHAHVQAALGRGLDRALPAGAVIVFNEVGALAYHARHATVVDMIGLTDPVTARIVREAYVTAGTSDTDACGDAVAQYVFSRHPDCVIVPSYRPIDLNHPDGPDDAFYAVWRRVYRHPVRQSHFVPVLAVQVHDGRVFNMFVRDNLHVDVTALTASLSGVRCARIVFLAGS